MHLIIRKSRKKRTKNAKIKILITYIGLLPFEGKTGFQNEDAAMMFFDISFY